MQEVSEPGLLKILVGAFRTGSFNGNWEKRYKQYAKASYNQWGPTLEFIVEVSTKFLYFLIGQHCLPHCLVSCQRHHHTLNRPANGSSQYPNESACKSRSIAHTSIFNCSNIYEIWCTLPYWQQKISHLHPIVWLVLRDCPCHVLTSSSK